MIRPIKLKTYSTSEIAKGATVDVLFGDQIPLIGPKNRIANVRGVYLFSETQYDVAAAGSGTTDWRYFLRMAYRNLTLTDNLGHVYIESLYGDEIFDHVGLINGNPLHREADPSVAAQLTNVTINTGLWIPFAPGRIDAPQDGGIALPLLDNRINSSAKLSFQIGTGTALDTGGSTFVTWDGLTGLTAFALVEYGDPQVDVNWFWKNMRNDQRTELVFPNPGATMRYVVARDGIDQTGSTDMSSTYYSNWAAEISGVAFTKGGENSIERSIQMGMTLEYDPIYLVNQLATGLRNEWGCFTSTPRAIPIYYPGPRAHRSDYSSGEINARFTRATKTNTSFFLNGFFDYPEAKTAFIAERCGMPVDAIRRVVSTLGPGGVNAGTQRKLPAKIKV